LLLALYVVFICTIVSVFSLVQFVLFSVFLICLYNFVLNPAYMLPYFNKHVCMCVTKKPKNGKVMRLRKGYDGEV